MKKVLFGLAFLGAMAFSGITAQGQGSVDPGESDYKWKQLICPETQQAFEVCWLTGDGNPCSTWGETTRDCPSFGM